MSDDPKNLGKRLGDLKELPEELRKQLQGSKFLELEAEIIEIIEELEGMANIDEILVGYYKKFSKVKKRQFIAGILYRMCRDGLIYSVEGKKGVYKLVKK